MDDKFDRAIDVVLAHEGGFADHPADPGGTTNWGVSLRYLKNAGIDINDDGVVDSEDVHQLTREGAKAIYREQFWLKYRYNEIRDLQLATKVFDLAVNVGPHNAHKLLQQALHAAGYRHVKVDGVLGSKTLAAVNVADPRVVLGALRAEARHYYEGLVRTNPSLRAFIDGWLNRAYS